MKIGVDFHLAAGPYQGSRRYLLGIYREISRLDQANHYFYCYNRTQEAPLPDGITGTRVTYGTDSGLKRLLIAVPRLSRRLQLDWFHFQHQAPLRCPARVALTIHDILYRTHPQFFNRRYALRAGIMAGLSCRRADQILVPSIYSQQQLQEAYSVPAEKITITPNGIDHERFHPWSKAESQTLIQERYGFADYILTVGRLEPRKNHLTLIRAYHILKQEIKDLPRLVIVGQPTFNFKQIYREITGLGQERDIIVIADADDDALPHLYRAALLFVYPSFAEGFGIPPLEAMASGCPVITSNTTAIPEVVGEAGILIDPGNPGELAEQMGRLLHDSALREQLSAAGAGRAAEFTWERSARAIMKIYNP